MAFQEQELVHVATVGPDQLLDQAELLAYQEQHLKHVHLTMASFLAPNQLLDLQELRAFQEQQQHCKNEGSM